MNKAENVSDFCETEYRNTGTNFMFREIPKSLFRPRPILSPFRGSARIRTFYGKHEKYKPYCTKYPDLSTGI